MKDQSRQNALNQPFKYFSQELEEETKQVQFSTNLFQSNLSSKNLVSKFNVMSPRQSFLGQASNQKKLENSNSSSKIKKLNDVQYLSRDQKRIFMQLQRKRSQQNPGRSKRSNCSDDPLDGAYNNHDDNIEINQIPSRVSDFLGLTQAQQQSTSERKRQIDQVFSTNQQRSANNNMNNTNFQRALHSRKQPTLRQASEQKQPNQGFFGNNSKQMFKQPPTLPKPDFKQADHKIIQDHRPGNIQEILEQEEQKQAILSNVFKTKSLNVAESLQFIHEQVLNESQVKINRPTSSYDIRTHEKSQRINQQTVLAKLTPSPQDHESNSSQYDNAYDTKRQTEKDKKRISTKVNKSTSSLESLPITNFDEARNCV